MRNGAEFPETLAAGEVKCLRLLQEHDHEEGNHQGNFPAPPRLDPVGDMASAVGTARRPAAAWKRRSSMASGRIVGGDGTGKLYYPSSLTSSNTKLNCYDFGALMRRRIAAIERPVHNVLSSPQTPARRLHPDRPSGNRLDAAPGAVGDCLTDCDGAADGT
jgi:hypothetical protein